MVYMFQGIKAVAFDIDGTIYASWRLFVRMPIYFFRHIIFFRDFNEVRKILRRSAPVADFYEYQARLFATQHKIDVALAKKEIQRICYDGLRPFFFKIKSFPNIYDTVRSLKAAGLKIAILSDFPPEQKDSVWGIRPLCDVCMSSEEAGALKPSKYAFGLLARRLNLKLEEILYVGNSVKYDIEGARNAGMKTAFVLTGWRRLFNRPLPQADISFKSYRQLCNIVLQ